MKAYAGQTLGETLITYKVDGVKAIRKLGTRDWRSRADKPLYNIPQLEEDWTEIEVYGGDWASSISLCRTKDAPEIPEKYCFNLNPVDSRLILGSVATLTPDLVDQYLKHALSSGYEGLVLFPEDGEPLKVKNKLTFDVVVEDIFEGNRRNEGRLGGFITKMGKVGTGLSDKQRADYWIDPPLGKIIEISCMEVNKKTGKARHPVFVRVREDLK